MWRRQQQQQQPLQASLLLLKTAATHHQNQSTISSNSIYTNDIVGMSHNGSADVFTAMKIRASNVAIAAAATNGVHTSNNHMDDFRTTNSTSATDDYSDNAVNSFRVSSKVDDVRISNAPSGLSDTNNAASIAATNDHTSGNGVPISNTAGGLSALNSTIPASDLTNVVRSSDNANEAHANTIASTRRTARDGVGVITTARTDSICTSNPEDELCISNIAIDHSSTIFNSLRIKGLANDVRPSNTTSDLPDASNIASGATAAIDHTNNVHTNDATSGVHVSDKDYSPALLSNGSEVSPHIVLQHQHHRRSAETPTAAAVHGYEGPSIEHNDDAVPAELSSDDTTTGVSAGGDAGADHRRHSVRRQRDSVVSVSFEGARFIF
jgi:hypothetical protein